MVLSSAQSPAQTEAAAASGGELSSGLRDAGRASANPERRIGSVSALCAHWREDRRVNRGSIFTPGFQALAVHRFGVWARELPGPASRAVFRRLYLVVNWFVRSFHGIELPAAARIGRRLTVGHQSGIVVHAGTVIGDDCLLRHNVTIGALRAGPSEPIPRIGDRVEIGAGAVLLGGITVGDDAVIGANAVVRVDVPANAVVLPPEPTIVIRRARAPRRPRGA